MCSPVNAYQEAVRRFANIDPDEVVAKSGAFYDGINKRFEIMYFSSLYRVNLEGKVWKPEFPIEEIPFNDRTLILQYLTEASGLPPRGRWLSFLELPDGAHHYAPLQTDAMAPLAEVFGKRAEEFRAASLELGGTPINMGDHSFLIPALPKIPLAVILWEGDDEFPAKSGILFDAVSQHHLTTAALWVLGVELARKMISCYDEKTGREKAITWLEGVRRN
ncbi:MAG: DUF3786 domain-containing protein [Bacillota bacterium]